MDQAAVRALTSQLADDFAWLEQHGQKRSGLALQAGELRLAAALVRNVLGPFLEGQPAEPLHLAVVGGAGAGKSTVANMLSGSNLAETNPQAGFTRHPIAYCCAAADTKWLSHLAFLGPLRRLTTPRPSSLDEDVYQLRRVAVEPGQFSLLDHFIIWDCPDITTAAAANYIPRVLEVVGLADVVVYVASDERYNDEIPTQFLKLLLASGKAVVPVMTKIQASQARAFLDHFQEAVLNLMPGRPVAVLHIPQLTREQLADPNRKAAEHRIPLLNQVSVFSAPARASRLRTVASGMAFLRDRQTQLLSVAQDDLAMLAQWRQLVLQGQAEFTERYRREFLANERFPRFDQSLVRLLELMEVPGIGRIVGTALRAPGNLVKYLFQKVTNRPPAPPLPEGPVLEASFKGWLDGLRKEAARRSSSHPVWRYIDRNLSPARIERIHNDFEQSLGSFRLEMEKEVERTARYIYEILEKNPAFMNTVRGAKFTAELGVLIVSITTLGWGILHLSVVVGLLGTWLMHQMFETVGRQFVEQQRDSARRRQEALVTHYLTGPLAEQLIQLPTSGGSDFEELTLRLGRIPESLQRLEPLVQQKLAEK